MTVVTHTDGQKGKGAPVRKGSLAWAIKTERSPQMYTLHCPGLNVCKTLALSPGRFCINNENSECQKAKSVTNDHIDGFN